jgi:hypothetical protein
MMEVQYVCTVCGYNMVGYYPEVCPFCGASRSKFITSGDCSAKFKVRGIRVNEKVTCLNSVPSLGLEHAAFRIEAEENSIWIDCPSSFNKDLKPVDTILFTHHHFLGASNQYRALFGSKVWIHEKDSADSICRGFTFDVAFRENFVNTGIQAFHIDGHTPRFTFYIFEDILFICDYVFLMEQGMKFNSFGPRKATREGGGEIHRLLKGREISTVCGYDYVCDFVRWMEKFTRLIATA